MGESALHIVALPHTQTTRDWSTCAYTAKIVKLCKLLTGRGRRVILYSSEVNEAVCDEHVVCVTEERRQEHFGPQDEGDLTRGGFDWEVDSVWWREMNSRAAGEVRARAEPHDLLCLTAGQAQELVADHNPVLTVAEVGVGYEGFLGAGGRQRRGGGPAYAAFESVTHQHLCYGLWKMQGQMNQRWFDTVIPNFFDPDEFPVPDRAARRRAERRGPYIVFLGRLIINKGPHVAAQIADRLGMRLVVAGPGAIGQGENWVSAPEIRVEAENLEYLGAIGWRERAELLAGAEALIAPTMYVEPFGGVAVEAMMAGCPAVTSPWGAFTETVREGVSGYRFHTLDEGLRAVQQAQELDRDRVREYAHERYSLKAVAPLYDRWFDRLDTLWEGGWSGSKI